MYLIKFIIIKLIIIINQKKKKQIKRYKEFNKKLMKFKNVNRLYKNQMKNYIL